MDSNVIIRPALPEDSATFVRIESDAYLPQFVETGETFLAKLNAFPEGCKIAEMAGQPVGHLLSHPWVLHDPPALDCHPFILPASPDCFYIHSLTLLKNAHGKGVGTRLAETALELGMEFGYRNFALISVQESHYFWEKFSFRVPQPLLPSVAQKLAGYGSSARFMVRP